MRIIALKAYVVEPLKKQYPQYQIVDTVEDGEILICEPDFCTQENLIKIPSLKWIQLSRAGYDKVDLDYIFDHSIQLSNARSLYSQAIAEDIMCKILMYSNNALEVYQNQQKHIYTSNTNKTTLSHYTVGFFGVGSISQACAKLLYPFGCEIIGYQRHKRDDLKEFQAIYYTEEFETFLSRCDILVLAASLNEESFHCINAQTIQFMKKGSVIINVGRGALIDELALIEAIKEKHFSFVGLDVFEQEPLPSTHPLYELDNVVITAHSAGMDVMNHAKFVDLVKNNIQLFIENKDLINQIETKR